VVGNCPALGGRAAGKGLAQSLGKLAQVALVEFLPTRRCSLTDAFAGSSIGQALLLGLLESRLLNQHPLTLVPLSRPTKPDNHCTES
jgi:hypothetical protein